MTDWPPDAPKPAKGTEYRIYWADGANTDELAARFEQRYGEPPAWIVEDKPWLYLGPIPPLPPPELESV